MTFVLEQKDALKLYEIIDSTVGFFREETMSETAIKYHETKKHEFIKMFTTRVPEAYWFQSDKISSIELQCDSQNGFHLVPTNGVNSMIKELIERSNKKLRLFASEMKII